MRRRRIGGVDGCVGVASYDDVNILAAFGDVGVRHSLCDVIPEVADGYHHLGTLLAQLCGGLVGFLESIEILHSCAVFLSYDAGRVEVETDKSNFMTRHFFHYRRHKKVFERGAREVIVGAETGAVDLRPLLGESVHTAVKLVVAEYAYVVAHLVHKSAFDLAAEYGEI